ncbi:transposase [Streptomyces phaeochromogenes]|uniref:Transposase n=1 Tax=Streptomyces phaeochromogenes TaxID=1923 RepID=A0ABZ1H9V8_STRPH|nr:hypothetical protein [Streptomyces phaeochromogenes]WSD14336.1 transposase [Streptomyces phaeochromogenes]
MLKKIARKGGGIVLLDGTLIRTRRTRDENRKNYSGKHKHPSLLVITLTDDKGHLPQVCAPDPDGPRRSPPADTANSPPNYGRPGSAPSPTWGSSGSTTTAPTPARQ